MDVIIGRIMGRPQPNRGLVAELARQARPHRITLSWQAAWRLAAARGQGINASIWPEARGTSGGTGAARQVNVSPARIRVWFTVLDERRYAQLAPIGFGAME